MLASVSNRSLRSNPRPLAWAIATAAIVALVAPTGVPAAGLFVVNEPWVRPAAAGSTDAYMNLQSSSGAALVGVRCELASAVTIEGQDSGRRGKFRAVPRIELPPGQTVRLSPGQIHIRLAAISHAFRLGEHVAMVLTLEAADGTTQEIPVSAEVRNHSPTEDEGRAHGHPAHPAEH